MMRLVLSVAQHAFVEPVRRFAEHAAGSSLRVASSDELSSTVLNRNRVAVNTLGCLVLAGCVSCGATDSSSPETSSSSTTLEVTTVSDTIEGSTDPPNSAGEWVEDADVDHSDDVLRHAVFFSFRETSSENDIKTVVSAFAELPSKIDSIIDFQWGTNNSPEGFDDGFTHCFLLTFKDKAGRAEYLPHDAHKAFGKVLGSLNDQVFVVDYWGTPGQDHPEGELKHAVFFKFKDDASAESVKKVEDAFAELPSKIDTITAFEWGRNNSPERHSHGFTHCFMVTFASDEGRRTYLDHPDHLAFVEVLKPILDKARVLDFTPGM